MKNKYIFKFDNEIESLQVLINKYKSDYTSIMEKYNREELKVSNYIQQRNLMIDFRNEMIKLLKNVVKSFKYFGNNAVIFLTGSYARNTVRLFSDLDLNIVYTNGNGKRIMKYEELFYYYICKCFDMKRETVHSIITAFNDEDNYNYIVNNVDDSNIDVKLIDKKNTIQYKITGGYKKRFYLQYMNNKNYKVIFNNLINKYKKDGIQEWSNNFIFLNDNKKVMNYYIKYQKQLAKNIDYGYVSSEFNILSDFKIENIDYNDNCDIKEKIQMCELHFLYKVIVLLQYLYLKDKKVIYSDYIELYNHSNQLVKKLLDYYYEYNYYIYKLNVYFEKYDFPYSIHHRCKIDINKCGDLKMLIDKIIIFRDKINKEYLSALKGEIKNVIK